MTLTAIDKSFQLFNPSLLFDQGVGEDELKQRMLELSEAGLYCPHCYRDHGVLLPVKFRNSQARRKHCYHPTDDSNPHKCNAGHKQSEQHLNGKAWLANKYQALPMVDTASVDVEWIQVPDGRKRKPDVLVTYKSGGREGHEIQTSRIDYQALIDRTNDMKAAGVVPIWYFKRGTYSIECRQWLWQNQVKHYLIAFDDDNLMEEPEPCGEPEPEKQRIPANPREDSCSKRVSEATTHTQPPALIKPATPRPSNYTPREIWVPLPEPSDPKPLDGTEQVGDRVVGTWTATGAKRRVQGWCGTIRAILPDGRLTVAFPPYGKSELTKDCKSSDLGKR